jgi:hypothetical protein
MTRVLRAAALFLVIGSVVFALTPFHVHLSSPGGGSVHVSCGAPIREAWHSTDDEGWFGYAPLNDGPVVGLPSCAPKARQRLAASVSGVLVAGLLALAAHLISRRARAGVRELEPPTSSA